LRHRPGPIRLPEPARAPDHAIQPGRRDRHLFAHHRGTARQALGAEHRRRSNCRYPGNYEAQTGQGPITLHSEEHLSGSDGGEARLRRFLEAQLKIAAAGGDPACVAFNEADAYLRLEAGQELLEGSPA
jgi:hypothetical protein